MITLKTGPELEIMAVGGKIAAEVLREIVGEAKAGMTLRQLDKAAEKKILASGAVPSFKGFEGYKFATCINVNEGVVHGIPNGRVLKNSDLLSVDLGVYYRGFHSDISWTVVVGGKTEVLASGFPKDTLSKKQSFLACGREALNSAIGQCKVGNRVGDISSVIQQTIESQGYNVVRDLVGHGIGRELHEDPAIPCFGNKERGLQLKAGMTLAIEVIYTEGSYQLAVEEDGWTIRTLDGQLGGLFEQTVAIRDTGPIVLTNTLDIC